MKSQLELNLSKLPSYCFTIDFKTPEIMAVYKGLKGYIPLKKNSFLNNPELREGETLDEYVDRFNTIIGVTIQQRMAMTHGSMFGFDHEHSNPDAWDEDGIFIMGDSIVNSIYRFETPESLVEFVENNLQVNEIVIYRSFSEKKFCVTGMTDIPLIEGEVLIFEGRSTALRTELLKLNS